MARIWDRFLTEQDRAHEATIELSGAGIRLGRRPALLLIDLYRCVFGDRPEPLLDAIKGNSLNCGLAGWEALPHIQRLLRVARELGVPVIHVTLDASHPEMAALGPTAKPDTAEARAERERRYKIVDEVAPLEGEIVLHKSSPSPFWTTPLAPILRQMDVDTLVVAGETTSGCVRATVVDGRSQRFKMMVVEECVFDRTEASHAMNLFDMHRKYANVVPLAEAIAYLRDVRSASDATVREPVQIG